MEFVCLYIIKYYNKEREGINENDRGKKKRKKRKRKKKKKEADKKEAILNKRIHHQILAIQKLGTIDHHKNKLMSFFNVLALLF